MAATVISLSKWKRSKELTDAARATLERIWRDPVGWRLESENAALHKEVEALRRKLRKVEAAVNQPLCVPVGTPSIE